MISFSIKVSKPSELANPNWTRYSSIPSIRPARESDRRAKNCVASPVRGKRVTVDHQSRLHRVKRSIRLLARVRRVVSFLLTSNFLRLCTPLISFTPNSATDDDDDDEDRNGLVHSRSQIWTQMAENGNAGRFRGIRAKFEKKLHFLSDALRYRWISRKHLRRGTMRRETKILAEKTCDSGP